MAKVSVIIPVFNSEKYLSRCLESIFNQTYQDFEIICINDCSPDGCQKILENYLLIYPDKMRVIVNEKNMRAGRSKDKAVKVATSEYVMYVDSDDYVKPDYIETYLDAIEREQVDIVVGGYIKDIDGKYVTHSASNSVWSITTYVIACAKMYRRSFILDRNMEFTEITCLEDMYFNLTAFCNHARYYVLPKYEGYYYYYNAESVTSTFDFKKNHEQQTIEAFDRVMKKCDINNLSKDEYWVLQYTYIANIVNSLITYNHRSGIKVMKQKYEMCIMDLRTRFPDYKKNPYIGICKPKGQSAKIRMGVGVVIGLNKIKLDRVIFYIVSMI